MTLKTASRVLQDRALWGVCLMLFGLALYALSDAFIKYFVEAYSVYQTSFLRAFTRLIPLLVAVFFQGGFKKVLGTKAYSLHAIRLSVSLFYTYSFMYAFSIASLTTIYTLSYTSAFFMILLSAVFLREKVGKEKWIAVAVGLLGVVVASHLSSGVFELAAIVVLFGAFLSALNKVLMRRLAATEHSLAIAIYPNIVMILVMLPFVLMGWKTMSWRDIGAFGFVGMITAGGQYAIAQALRFAQGSTLAPIDYSSFFWVLMLDFFWWMKTPDVNTVCGALLIIGSNLYILYRSRLESQPRLDNTKASA